MPADTLPERLWTMLLAASARYRHFKHFTWCPTLPQEIWQFVEYVAVCMRQAHDFGATCFFFAPGIMPLRVKKTRGC
jgi:hypothetical protein